MGREAFKVAEISSLSTIPPMADGGPFMSNLDTPFLRSLLNLGSWAKLKRLDLNEPLTLVGGILGRKVAQKAS